MRFLIRHGIELAALPDKVFTSVLDTLYEWSQSQALRGIHRDAG